MKKLLIIIVTFALLCVTATVTFGYPFQIYKPGYSGYGARADAMGGAFTAIANDGFAPYYNPAGMTQLKALALTGSLGFYSEDSSVLLLSGFGGITTSSLAANVYFDELVDSDGSYFGTYNYVLSAATTLFTKAIAIGGNVKLVSDVIGSSDGYSGESGATIAFDLAGLIKPTKFLSIGVVGRNINEPTIESFGDNISPSLSMGVALKPSSSTTLAADLEILKVTFSDVGEVNLKKVRFGLEQTALWESIAVRLGVSGNPEYFADTQVISGGFGLKIFGVYADMAIIGLTSNYPEVEISGGFRY